jgi:hypothetical protein
MSESVLSFGNLGFAGANTQEWDHELPPVPIRRPSGWWNAEKFADEQVRGLVRVVFSTSAPRPVRQVVFSAVEATTDVRSLCMRVAETLALETLGDIAVLGGYPQIVRDDSHNPQCAGRVEQGSNSPLHQAATHIRSNVWLLPAKQKHPEYSGASPMHAYLAGIRREFEYSIVAAPSAEESGEAMGMAQIADGVILVLSASNTRRAAARKIKERIDQARVRLLGTVLSDREFPIPAGIYRRL